MNALQRLGKYQITEVLGEGAMGVVYKGFDPDIRRVVALKTIRRDLDDGSEFGDSIAARFRNEAQAAGRLQHPGVVAVYDYGEDERVAYIAMEYVEGNNLAHYLRNKIRFTDEDVHSVVCQLLDALEHAHAQGVWHRDIKPANLILTRAGRIKVADFGIARIDSANLTRASTMIGTPSHMAPEQFIGAAIDQRVDIYGTGVVLFQLLTGRAPFVGPTESLTYRVVHEAAPRVSTVDDGASRPRGYDAIVARALAKHPDERFADAAAFRAAVQSAIGAPVADTVSDRTVVAVPPRQPVSAVVPSTASSAAASPATHWDAGVLSKVESTLARHVGPVAAVLVRRAARDCADLPSLWARLAQDVTSASVRSELLAHASLAGQVPAAGASMSRSAAGGASVDEALLERAEKLLAQHVGPIARVLVKKAAAAGSERSTFVARLADSIADVPERRRFIDELDRPH